MRKWGENGSELKLAKGGKVKVKLRAASRLPLKGDESIADRPYAAKPYWHVERARIKGTRNVDVEILQNGFPVAKQTILADGRVNDLEFDINVTRSSWLAARILPSAHTNPIFVIVDDKPIRAFKRSAEWCLKGVDQCWKNKERFIDADEMEDAKAAYAHAREVYKQILGECEWE